MTVKYKCPYCKTICKMKEIISGTIWLKCKCARHVADDGDYYWFWKWNRKKGYWQNFIKLEGKVYRGWRKSKDKPIKIEVKAFMFR